MAQLSVGTSYSFNTKAPSILGASVKNAKLSAIFDYVSARAFEDIDLKYRRVLPLLPAGTPDSVKSAIYYKFTSENGENFIMCNQWIDETSLVEVQYVNITVRFTMAQTTDVTAIRDALNSKGLTGYLIDVN